MINYYAIPGLRHRARYGKRKEIIIDTICEVMGNSRRGLFVGSRRRDKSKMRHIIMYFLRKKTIMTLSEIGDIFNMNHSSVIHAEKTVMSDIKRHQPTADLVTQIEIKLNNLI